MDIKEAANFLGEMEKNGLDAVDIPEKKSAGVEQSGAGMSWPGTPSVSEQKMRRAVKSASELVQQKSPSSLQRKNSAAKKDNLQRSSSVDVQGSQGSQSSQGKPPLPPLFKQRQKDEPKTDQPAGDEIPDTVSRDVGPKSRPVDLTDGGNMRTYVLKMRARGHRRTASAPTHKLSPQPSPPVQLGERIGRRRKKRNEKVWRKSYMYMPFCP